MVEVFKFFKRLNKSEIVIPESEKALLKDGVIENLVSNGFRLAKFGKLISTGDNQSEPGRLCGLIRDEKKPPEGRYFLTLSQVQKLDEKIARAKETEKKS